MTAGLFQAMAHPSTQDGEGEMPIDPIEPLEWKLWCDSLERLAQHHARGAPLKPCLRLAYHLAMLAPPPFSQIIRVPLDEQQFEELIDEEDYDAAVRGLLGPVVSFEVAHGPPADEAIARVWLPEFREGRGRAPAAAPALFAAWLDFLALLRPDQTRKSFRRLE